MSGEEFPAAVAAIGALGDPTRRALYRYVAAQRAPVGREDAASAVGIPRHVARFHLDRLQDAGLLQIEYTRPAGRGGPGAGHPTKLYRPTTTEFAVSVPERRYDIAGLVLTRAVATAIESDIPVASALEDAAGETGRTMGRAAKPPSGHAEPHAASVAVALETLDTYGFAPRAENGGYVLANCPFRALAQQAPEVVCQMNFALVTSLLQEIGVRTASAQLDSADGRCCVTVRSAMPGE